MASKKTWEDNLNQNKLYLLNKQNWIFAKTMKNNPHYYIVKNDSNIDIFNMMNEYIENNFILQKFYKKEYKIVIIENTQYWLMNSFDWREKAILNKKYLW